MGLTAGEALVERFFEPVHGYVRLRVPATDRDDVVAEVFLRALERKRQVRSDDPGPWIFAIARSRVADYYRRRGAAVSAQDPPQARRDTPLEELERKEFVSLLHRKMEELPEAERDVIAFKFTDGLSNPAIAALLGITPNHLGVLLHRALSRLRRAMLREVDNGVH